jgi:hypothetical protein
MIRPDDAEGFRGAEFLGGDFERLRPGDRFELVARAEHRRLQAVGMLDEIECVAAFHAEELAVDA